MTANDPANLAICSWEARALYWLMQRLLNEQGVLESNLDLEGTANYLSVELRMPVINVQNALVEMIKHGVINAISTGIFDTHFASRNEGLSGGVENQQNKKKKKNKNKEDKNTCEDKPRGRPPGDPRHHAVYEVWHRLWLARPNCKEKYEFQPRDGTAVARFLKGHPDTTVAEVETRMRRAFSDKWFATNGNPSMFFPKWSNYDGAGVALPPRLPRIIGYNGEATVYEDDAA